MPVAIRAGRLLDGTGQPSRRNALILIEQNPPPCADSWRALRSGRPARPGVEG